MESISTQPYVLCKWDDEDATDEQKVVGSNPIDWACTYYAWKLLICEFQLNLEYFFAQNTLVPVEIHR